MCKDNFIFSFMNRHSNKRKHSPVRWQDEDRKLRDSRSLSRIINRNRISSKAVVCMRPQQESNNAKEYRGKCLGVFGLSSGTTESDLCRIFRTYGSIERVSIVRSHDTGLSRCYGFVYFEKSYAARRAKEQCDGIRFDRRIIRVEFSNTYRPQNWESRPYRVELRDRNVNAHRERQIRVHKQQCTKRTASPMVNQHYSRQFGRR
ncbi:transformer-2 protein homolog beta-like [Wyeomyia smithii]|uniref:transformer-2 protein homolog beta-like n=1 Tax=Wyeomyia smithii TaxID=174621 RepID=UPI002467E575|nr:transformer-2 protein homolog beta-like [Wyeomyia smithii]